MVPGPKLGSNSQRKEKANHATRKMLDPSMLWEHFETQNPKDMGWPTKSPMCIKRWNHLNCLTKPFELGARPSWGRRVNIQDGLYNRTKKKRFWWVEIKLGHFFSLKKIQKIKKEKRKKKRREKLWTFKCHGSF